MYSREDTVNWLLAKRSNPNLSGGPMKQTCVHLASARRSGQSAQVWKIFLQRLSIYVLKIVKILLSHGKPEMRSKEDSGGSIPLFCAIDSTNHNVCRELLAKDPEQQVGMIKILGI